MTGGAGGVGQDKQENERERYQADGFQAEICPLLLIIQGTFRGPSLTSWLVCNGNELKVEVNTVTEEALEPSLVRAASEV